VLLKRLNFFGLLFAQDMVNSVESAGDKV